MNEDIAPVKSVHPDDALIITPTEFKDTKTGEVTYGFRVCGPQGLCIYCNLLEEPPPKDDKEFLALVVDNADDQLAELLDGCLDHKEGLFISQTWYDFVDIADIIDI